jgi:hypothetical protein
MHGALAAAACRSAEIKGQARSCQRRAQDTTAGARSRTETAMNFCSGPQVQKAYTMQSGHRRAERRGLFALAGSGQGHRQPRAPRLAPNIRHVVRMAA